MAFIVLHLNKGSFTVLSDTLLLIYKPIRRTVVEVQTATRFGSRFYSVNERQCVGGKEIFSKSCPLHALW